MRRPAIPFALALALGIGLGRAGAPLLVLVVAAGLALVTGALLLARRGARAGAPLGLALVAAGLAGGEALEWNHYRRFPADHVHWRAAGQPRDIVLAGRVLDEPFLRVQEFVKFSAVRVEAESIERDGKKETASGTVSVYVWRAEPLELGVGDRVRLEGTLSAPRGPTNPGETDRRDTLEDEGIHAMLSVPRAGAVEVLERDTTSIGAWIARLRVRLRKDLLAAVPGEAGTFLDSILLGTRTQLSEDVIEDFRRTGTIHMLVVSGQHLSLLAAFIWLIFARGLRLPPRAAISATLGFALVYCLLTGAQPSIVRATIMVAIFLLGKLLRREPDTMNSLALAAIAILALAPGSLGNLGFQLSFLAILGLELFYRPLERSLAAALPAVGARAGLVRRAGLLGARWAGGAIVASFGAWLTTAPLILWKFHLVTPGLLLSNLAAAAVCAAVLYSGFALLFVAPFSSTLAAPIAWVAGSAAELFMWLMHVLARVPGAYAYVADVSGWQVLAAYAAVGATAIALGVKREALGRVARFRPALAGATIVAAGVVLLPAGPREVGAGAARLAVLEVGTGLATVLRTDGGTVLFDCGGGRTEIGTRVAAPFLWREGVRRIDAIYVSHAHADHLNGIVDLADRFAVGRVYVGPWFTEGDGSRRLLAALRARRVPVETLEAGRTTQPAAGVEVDVLAPPRKEGAPAPRRATRGEPRRPGYEGQNDTSLVLRVRAGGRRVLFTGDIEEDGIALLAATGADLEADVALVPHHGAKNECMEDLAALVTPRLAIASAKPGFGDPASLAAFERYGARVLETAAGGAVLVDLRPGGVEARSFLDVDDRGARAALAKRAAAERRKAAKELALAQPGVTPAPQRPAGPGAGRRGGRAPKPPASVLPEGNGARRKPGAAAPPLPSREEPHKTR